MRLKPKPDKQAEKRFRPSVDALERKKSLSQIVFAVDLERRLTDGMIARDIPERTSNLPPGLLIHYPNKQQVGQCLGL